MRDLFFPDSRPTNPKGAAPGAEPSIPRSASPGPRLDEFASLMDRALDAEAQGGERGEGRRERVDHLAPLTSHLSPTAGARGKGRKGQRASEAPDGFASADSAEQTEEGADESAPDSASGLPAATHVGDALAPNIILLPPVVIPLPAVLTVEGGGSSAAMDSAESVLNPVEPERASLSLEQLPPSHTSEGRVIAFTAESATGLGRAEVATATQAGDAAAADEVSDADEASEGGMDVAPLKMLPVEEDEPDNIKVIDFRQPAEAKIIPFPLAGALSAERNGEPGGAAQAGAALLEEGTALSQLSGEEGEEFAQIAGPEGLMAGPRDNPKGVTKPIVHGALSGVAAATVGSVEATGISTARQESRMDSMKNSERVNAFAGRGLSGPEEFPPASGESSQAEVKATDFAPRISGAMDWPLGRPVGSFDRPSLVPAVPLSPEQSATVDRVSSLILRETSLVRQYSSDSMAVVLRPDDSTELYVHFARRNGQIEATIRCDRGDAQQLGALWPQLQESLAQQRVRLAPLQEGASANSNSNFNHASGFGAPADGRGSQRQSPSDRQSMDERSAPASSSPDGSHVRGRGGSRRRLTTSRPGWETWA